MNPAPLTLFLDFDGVLHGSSGAPFTQSATLLTILRPYLDTIEIVISSSWCRVHSLDKIRSFLPDEIAARVSDALYAGAPEQRGLRRASPSRYADIIAYLERRPDVQMWLAIDDDNSGWPAHAAAHLAHCKRDLGDPVSQQTVRDALERLTTGAA